MSRGVQMSVNYGWSRSRGNTDMEGGALTDPSDIDRDLGRNNGDLRHSLSAQGSYAPSSRAASRG
ncbi:MAG: hypothetical protein R2712_08400 [Vicinamibacterales bacterium]